MSYEFQNTLFKSRNDLCEAIAGAWISAGGANAREYIEKVCTEANADELVSECIDGFGLTEEWLSDRGIDAMHLYSGFLAVMEDPAKAFGLDWK